MDTGPLLGGETCVAPSLFATEDNEFKLQGDQTIVSPPAVSVRPLRSKLPVAEVSAAGAWFADSRDATVVAKAMIFGVFIQLQKGQAFPEYPGLQRRSECQRRALRRPERSTAALSFDSLACVGSC